MPKKPYNQYTQEALDRLMDNKWKKMAAKYPRWNTQYLVAMHKLLDWYEKIKYQITN